MVVAKEEEEPAAAAKVEAEKAAAPMEEVAEATLEGAGNEVAAGVEEEGQQEREVSGQAGALLG